MLSLSLKIAFKLSHINNTIKLPTLVGFFPLLYLVRCAFRDLIGRMTTPRFKNHLSHHMLKLILLGSATLAAAQETLHKFHGSDGQVKFSVNGEGAASAAGSFSAPIFEASTSLSSPSVTATTTLMVGETNVADTFDANAAERAAMQQTIDKLEADSAANQIAEQEQNSRVEKLEADQATNSASDVELAERVSKGEAEAEMASKAEEEQNTKLEQMQKDWQDKMDAQKAAFEEKTQAMETKHQAEHEAQQKVLDHLVKIMSRFDVSGELDALRQANDGQSTGEGQ